MIRYCTTWKEQALANTCSKPLSNDEITWIGCVPLFMFTLIHYDSCCCNRDLKHFTWPEFLLMGNKSSPDLCHVSGICLDSFTKPGKAQIGMIGRL